MAKTKEWIIDSPEPRLSVAQCARSDHSWEKKWSPDWPSEQHVLCYWCGKLNPDCPQEVRVKLMLLGKYDDPT